MRRPKPPLQGDLAPLLNAFDLIQATSDHCRFGDVETLRTAATLLEDGHELSSVVRILLQAQSAPSGRYRIVTDDRGEPRLDWGGALTGLDGQGLLPLPDQPDLDDLFDAALLAEAEGRLHDAARDYALCARMDRRDPISPFNLANVLVKLGETQDALTHFARAISRDPGLTEAYYNRAQLWEAQGSPDRASKDLRAAITADPTYANALFNLAQLELLCGAADAAASLLERVLRVETSPDRRLIASKALAVAKKKQRAPRH